MRILLAVIVLVEIAFGVLYAVETPRWEAPDEPAQFNYVRQIAETGGLPVLQPGDYNQAYLDKLKSDKFQPDEPVDSIRYEDYQPPLYYLLAAPVYLAARAFGLDTALALRLLDVALGALLLLLAYQVLQHIFPENKFLALAGVGLIAVVPMHIALSAAVNADTLAEVLLAALLLISFDRMSGRLGNRAFILFGGIVYGLALLTSTKIYAAALLLIAAEAFHRWGKAQGVDRNFRFSIADFGLGTLLPLFALSLLLSGWWFARNTFVYGGADIFGWARHDAVVVGQPTTAEWVARYGLKNIVSDFFIITFKSFWAQFGWMGVLVNDRIYVALFALTAVALFGAFLFVVRLVRERGAESGARLWRWGLVGLWLLLVLLAHVWYNLRYVQPQGRYLFPALIPIAALFAAGLYEVVDKRYARVIFALLYLALLGLDYVSLFWYIIPQLRA